MQLKRDILAFRGESQLPTLNINGRNPTVDGSEDMPLLWARREEGAAGRRSTMTNVT